MSKRDFFPQRPEANPTIYAYELTDVSSHQGLLKVGYTSRTSQGRIAEQLKTSRIDYKIVYETSAMRSDGTAFTDYDVHHYLRKKGITNTQGEWFRCTIKDIKAAIIEIKSGIKNEDNRTLDFGMRPEQEEAVNKTISYFSSFRKENKDKTPHFLWNAKMRFGKTFATYQLAKKIGWKKLLVLTFKPAVQSAWDEDLQTHVDFRGWQFISSRAETMNYADADKSKPIVCFGSFQDYLGKNEAGGIKARNEWVTENLDNKKPDLSDNDIFRQIQTIIINLFVGGIDIRIFIEIDIA